MTVWQGKSTCTTIVTTKSTHLGLSSHIKNTSVGAIYESNKVVNVGGQFTGADDLNAKGPCPFNDDIEWHQLFCSNEAI